MKNKGIKITLIIILAIIVIALVNFMIYAIINRNNDYSVKFSLIAFGDNTEKIFEKEYEPEELDKINVDVSSSNVLIEKADVDKIKVTAYGEKDEKINETINNHELSITKSKTKVFIFAMLYWCDEKIIIQVPNDCDEEFNIQTSSGDIEVGTVGESTIKTSSGKILVGEARRLQAEASSGEIEINRINEYCNLTISSGSIDVETLNITENSSINAKSGNVEIKNKNDIYIETETNSGDVDVKNNNRMAESVLKITTTSGSIRID